MQDLLEEAEVAAHWGLRVLITGEAGAGKAWLARVIHEASPRASTNLIPVAIEGIGGDTLAETLANASGTILLRGIERMTRAEQVALMAWLDSACDGVRPRVTGELLCTADASLFERVSDGDFRSDLFYRLNTIHLSVPPLRDRPEDVRPLLEKFVRMAAARIGMADLHVDPTHLSRYEGYPWPGNVRELREVAEQIVLAAREESNTH